MHQRFAKQLMGAVVVVCGLGCSQGSPEPQPSNDAGAQMTCPADGGVLVANPGINVITPVQFAKDCPVAIVFKGPSVWGLPAGVTFIQDSPHAGICTTGFLVAPDGGQTLLDGGVFTGLQTFVVSARSDHDGGFLPVTGRLFADKPGSAAFAGIGYVTRSTEPQVLTLGATFTEYAAGSGQLTYRVQVQPGTLRVVVTASEQEVTLSASGPGGATSTSSPSIGTAKVDLVVAQAGEVSITVDEGNPGCPSESSEIQAPAFDALPPTYRLPLAITASQL